MLKIFDPLRDLTFVSMVFRMTVAALCSAVIGLERASKNRPAGLRTHILICMAAAIASMTGHFLYLDLHLPTDMTRIGAQVVSGLGFLGAGTIIVTNRHTIKGLTTAASLWATGIIGLVIGAGFYEAAIAASLLLPVIQVVFSKVGYNPKYTAVFTLSIAYDHKKSLDAVTHYCERKGLDVIDVRVSGGENENPRFKAVLSIRPARNLGADELISYLNQTGDFVSVCQIDRDEY